MVDAIAPRLRVDAGMSRSDIVGVARSLLGIEPAQLVMTTMPWQTARLRAGLAGLDAGPQAADLTRQFAVAREVTQLEQLLQQPVIGGSQVDCR